MATSFIVEKRSKSMFNLLCSRHLALAASSNVRVFGSLGHVLIRVFSSNISSESATILSDQQQSITLSYLINSCGLSPQAANVASKRIILKSPEKSDIMLNLFRNHGFSDAAIAKLVGKEPRVLLAKPEKTILPNLKFFQSIGMPTSLLVQLTCTSPAILSCSFENRLIPFYHYLKNLVQTDERVIRFFNRSRGRFTPGLLKRLPHNITMLKKYGVSDSKILFWVTHHPQSLTMRSDKLANLVDKAIKLDVDISKLVFVEAIQVFYSTSESAREHKRRIYRRWGWSDSDIQMAFLAHPICMCLSEENITSTMEFLVNEMKCEPKDIARRAIVLYYNLEKRVMPRCRVVKVLMVKGLIKSPYGLTSFILITDEKFLKRFVMKYQEKVPQLLDVYNGKLGILDLGFNSSQLAAVGALVFPDEDFACYWWLEDKMTLLYLEDYWLWGDGGYGEVKKPRLHWQGRSRPQN